LERVGVRQDIITINLLAVKLGGECDEWNLRLVNARREAGLQQNNWTVLPVVVN